MSKSLSRVRALVSEIDVIQTEGRRASSIPLMKAVQAPQAAPPVLESVSPAQESASEASRIHPLHQKNIENPAPASPSEGKVFIQLTGKIAVQLQLEHTDEVVEVRQQGETIEIRFTDGKAIHLPLKNVA